MRCVRVRLSALASIVSGDAVCTSGVILLRTSMAGLPGRGGLAACGAGSSKWAVFARGSMPVAAERQVITRRRPGADADFTMMGR